MTLDHIRNFAIIAHIDHGKSTLADRLIEYCGGLESREMRAQVLDSMDIERERGITIKAQTVRLHYQKDGKDYILNLIDTPGHVDFSYEVSRSLAACEGSLLVVDASQGVEAQTLANVYQAMDNNHEIIPVLNKVDLPAAEPDRVKEQIESIIGIDSSDALLISAKTGLGIKALLDAIIDRLPPAKGDASAPLKALLVDSWYDPYIGVFIITRIFDGELRRGQKITMVSNHTEYVVDTLGTFSPKKVPCDILHAGEVGYFTASIRQVSDCNVGDTITDALRPTLTPLPGFKPNLPVVFCGLYPTDSSEFEHLRDSLGKLRLNDASFEYEMETSNALGFGFRCGFLGLLHLEVVQERLEREFNLDIITTAPSVVYQATLNNGTEVRIHTPVDMPESTLIKEIREPWIIATIMTPDTYVGDILQLCTSKRGEQKSMQFSGSRVLIEYYLPLNEMVYDFYDRLKSYTQGYASFDWHMAEYRVSDLVKLTILVNANPVDALSLVVHRSSSESRGRQLCQRLAELIPRQLFQIAVQASIGARIIARETVKALRKDVTSKCYGGDISRKRKLLEKQKAGKKRMRSVGNVEIPQSAFIAALKIGDE